MNWDLIWTIFGIGLAVLILTPFYLILAITYLKAKAGILKEVFTEVDSTEMDDDTWARIFQMKGDE